MRLINEINTDAYQSFKFGLDNGAVVDFTLRFVDNQKGWFYSVTYAPTGFSALNRRLVATPNLLRAFRNILPFGLALTTTDGQEPVFQEDFVNGRAKLYLLNEADVTEAERVIHA